MNYQKIILAGNATADAKRQTSQTGEVTFTTFSLGVSDGKEKSIYFPVAVFGKQGESVAEYVRKGKQLLVEGRVQISEDGRLNVVASRVVFGASAEKPARQTDE